MIREVEQVVVMAPPSGTAHPSEPVREGGLEVLQAFIAANEGFRHQVRPELVKSELHAVKPAAQTLIRTLSPAIHPLFHQTPNPIQSKP